MNPIEFEIETHPVGFKRVTPFFNKKTNKRGAFNDPTYSAFKHEVKLISKQYIKEQFIGPVKLECEFHLLPSKYSNLKTIQDKIEFISKLRKENNIEDFCVPDNHRELDIHIKKLCLSNKLYPTSMKQGDIDNFLKSILDSLNGVAYIDDAQVVDVSAIKLYSNVEKVIIRIRGV